jgi:hypothetical protein
VFSTTMCGGACLRDRQNYQSVAEGDAGCGGVLQADAEQMGFGEFLEHMLEVYKASRKREE